MPQPLPSFGPYNYTTLADDLRALLDKSRSEMRALVARGDFTWDGLMQPWEDIDDTINLFWSPISHLNSVMNSDELRSAYEQCLPLLSRYGSELNQDTELFEGVQALANSDQYASLSEEQQRVVTNSLRDFKLGGVALKGEAKERYKTLHEQLSELATRFSNNVLDATNGWQKNLADDARLSGVPDSAKALYQQIAEQRGEGGYTISLDFPSYLPILQYCEDRELRKELYLAYATRASEISGELDNSELMVSILKLRGELAELLGFGNYAELSLATKMATSTSEVIDFLEKLARTSRPQAEQEFQELRAFAAQDDLQAWDLPFYSERLKQQRYSVSQEELRPYFPLPTVMEGLFKVTGQLFGIEFELEVDAEKWHDDAQCHAIIKDGEKIAWFYTDLYARDKKRGGAWMANDRGRRYVDGTLQNPVAFLVCNFTPPTKGKPSLLTFDEVTTLFHEFGHGLHHMLTEKTASAVAGINGVAWDAVELPSQFLENWCWQPEVIPLISGHFESGEPLPEALLDKALAAKNFQSGMQMMRQLEFALFDFKLHAGPPPNHAQEIQALLNHVREEVAVVPVPPENRFQHSFSHIFAGGYAAGYYSYKWAEVLSADAFSRFEEEGVMNPDLGKEFLDKILSQGGSKEPMDLFVDFRGREPEVGALLRHSGIEELAA